MSSKKTRRSKKQTSSDVLLMPSLGLTKSAQEHLELDSAELENLKLFKTTDGKHYTGLLNDDRLIVDLFRPEEPLQTYSPSSYAVLPLKRLLKATVGGRLYPDFIDIAPACGNITNLSIGSCYMHANVNFAKWFVWMRTGKKHSPSNNTIDYVYAQGVEGGMAYDIKRLWDAPDDDFITDFKREAAICGLTQDNCRSYTPYNGTGNAGKENAIKLFSEYGPLWFAHDCGLYCNSSGYHAILMIGYDTNNIYFLNSWGGKSLPNVTVSWDNFTTYNHLYNTFFVAFGNISGVNLFKNL